MRQQFTLKNCDYTTFFLYGDMLSNSYGKFYYHFSSTYGKYQNYVSKRAPNITFIPEARKIASSPSKKLK